MGEKNVETLSVKKHWWQGGDYLEKKKKLEILTRNATRDDNFREARRRVEKDASMSGGKEKAKQFGAIERMKPRGSEIQKGKGPSFANE